MIRKAMRKGMILITSQTVMMLKEVKKTMTKTTKRKKKTVKTAAKNLLVVDKSLTNSCHLTTKTQMRSRW